MSPRPSTPREISPSGALNAVVRVPGSKSLTNRAYLIAGLANGPSEVTGGLVGDDSEAMIGALRRLGCRVEEDSDALRITGRGGAFSRPDGPLDLRNSGTSARFLTAAACLGEGPVVIDGNARMRERPIGDLVDALTKLGAEAEIVGRDGCPPVRLAGGGMRGGEAGIDASASSQYVSAILLAAPYAKSDVALCFENGVLVSRPYVDLTLDIMRRFGADAEWIDESSLRVTSGQPYRARAYAVEADASAAVYPFCAAAIAGGRVRVEGIAEGSLQSDFRILELLERMGCRVARGAGWAEVEGTPAGLSGIDVDMNDLPDAALALAVVALFATGPTRLRNIWNLRIKETDRLAALETELRKLGADARADRDSLSIAPGPHRAATIDTYDDHRLAMSFSLAGLRIPGVAIDDPGCVAKTWPDYWAAFDAMLATGSRS